VEIGRPNLKLEIGNQMDWRVRFPTGKTMCRWLCYQRMGGMAQKDMEWVHGHKLLERGKQTQHW